LGLCRYNRLNVYIRLSFLSFFFLSIDVYKRLAKTLLMMSCCNTERMLFVVQYKTNPAGKVIKKIVNNRGKSLKIFACMGSVMVFGVTLWCQYIDAPIRSGKIKYGSIKTNLNDEKYIVINDFNNE
ncbi:hypothetical protein ACM26_06395, partial [Helicobacter pylori]